MATGKGHWTKLVTRGRDWGSRASVAVFLIGLALTQVAAGCSASSRAPLVPSLPPTTATPSSTVADAPGLAVPDRSDEPDEPNEPDDAIHLAVGDDIQAKVDAAQDGARFVVEPGIHRLQEIHPRDGMTFEGLPGSVLSGAIKLNEWDTDEGKVWYHDGIAPTVMEHGECIDGYDGCRLSQDLYMDNVMLWQVTDRSDVTQGTWYWDEDRILVADDPTARNVELSVAVYAFVGDVSDITIRNVIIEKYAIPAQFGAIQAEARGGGAFGRRWLIEDTEVRLNHGAGIRIGDDTIVRRSFVHDNGQLGIAAAGGSGSIVEDCEIANNNLAGFEWGWEGGGSKFKETSGLIVRRNYVHDNVGPGLWTDINNRGTLYEGNLVEDNAGPGIYHEISFDAIVRSNTVTGNGFGFPAWLWGSGILISAADGVEVLENTVTGNADGIGGVQQSRDGGPEGPYLLADLFVHDNIISANGGHTGVVEDNGDRSVFTDRGNRFESNTYVDTDGRRFAWDGQKLDAAGWRAKGQDLDGTWNP